MRISSLFNKTSYNGAPAVDERTASAKEKDYKRDEVHIAGSPRLWQNEKATRLTTKEKNQWRTSSCVPHAILTQLEYEGLLLEDPSDLALYRRRVNFAGEGANGVDLLDKARKGLSRYSEYPTPAWTTEAYANALPLVLGAILTKPFKYFQYDALYRPDKARAQRIIADVARGKAVVVFYYSTNVEARREYMEPTDRNVTLGTAQVRHAVVLIPKKDFQERGKNWASLQDSAQFGGLPIHHMSEEFIESRVYWAAIVEEDKAVPTPPVKPTLPTIACQFGQTNSAVRNLQGFLISEGFLEPQYQTGYYGALTARAVLWYQLFNHQKFTDTIPELLALKGHWWGQQSINSLKK